MMPNSNEKPQKEYFCDLSDITTFYVPHQDANHLNAQDIVFNLVGRTKDISTVTWNCFEDGTKLVIEDKVVANLIYEMQTKLEMIEKLLPMAFGYLEGKQ